MGGPLSVPLGACGSKLAEVRGDLATFARSYSVRGGRLAWLLGAGASAMSGIPTAGALIYRFKHALYCSANNLDVQTVDEVDRNVRGRIEHYFDGKHGLPPLGDPDEYAVAFDAMFPSADVRLDFIAEIVRSKRPNFGHHVLAALMADNLLRAVFTTNFDDLVEQAAHSLLDSHIVTPRRALTVAELSSGGRVAKRAFDKDSWPLVAKLHGDFRSDRLKNVRIELQTQDGQMRSALLESCHRFGLIVAGYSGRDHSIMAVLDEALNQDDPFPGGLVWCYRPGDPPSDGVLRFLLAARHRKVDVEAIAVDNFIELAGAIARAVTFTTPVRTWLTERQPTATVTSTPIPVGPTRPFPILRLNALPLTAMPTHAIALRERSPCDLGEAQTAIRSNRARGLIARLGDGRLVAVGHAHELRSALGGFELEISDSPVDLAWDAEGIDSGGIGLALDALTLGLGRTEGLRHVLARRGHQIRVLDPNVAALERLAGACGSLTGTVPKTSLHWAEAVGVNIERRAGQWWLLLVPEIWLPPGPSGQPPNLLDTGKWRAEQQQRGADFIRERRATRHNRETNAILDAWVRLLCAGRGPRVVRTWNLQATEGLDPSFELVGLTAYSQPFAETAHASRAGP